MRKIKLFAVISAFVLSLGLMMAPVHAEEAYINISSYKETFKPAADNGATLTVEVKATAGDDGYVYLVKSNKSMTLVEMTGENIGTELVEYKEGGATYFRVATLDKTVEATVKATFSVAGFYPTAQTAEDNGGSNFKLTYKFTNPFTSAIGKYVVTVYVPEGHETVKVLTPAKYDKQILGIEDGLRYVGASGKLAADANTTVEFTYNTPMSSTMKIVLWVGAIAVGGFVFFDRYKKAKAA